jgi:ABC-type bacteriocin/lantibiotic exporter with double-glycine peptidase domain
MKENTNTLTPFGRIWNLVRHEKTNVRYLYVYAILSGAISLMIPLGIQAIIGLVLSGRLSSSWYILVFFITLAVFVSGLTRLAQMSIMEAVQRRLFVRVAFDFSQKLTGAQGILKKYPGLVELSEKFLDVITVQKSFTKLLLYFTASVLQIAFGIILLAIYHPIFLIFGLLIILLVIAALRLTWKAGIASARSESDYKFKTAYWLTEIAQNKTTFNLKREQGYHSNRIDQYLKGYVRSRIQHFRVLYRQAGIAVAMKVLLTAVMLVIGSMLLVAQDISLGQFLAAEILIISMVEAVEKLVISVESIYDAGIALEKLGAVTDAGLDQPASKGLRIEEEQARIPKISIRSEKDTQPWQVEIKPGEKIAVCGLPGFGRTNILKSIIGEFEARYPASINDIPVENFDHKELGKMTGICLQGSALFEGTLAENIALNPEADIEELSRLSKMLNFHHFVNEIEDGFNHYFEVNNTIPNNINRKITIARALYQSPGLVLIDDIWSAFTKKEIDKLMDYIMQMNATVIIISNHLPVLQTCDRSYYLGETGLEEIQTKNINALPDFLEEIIWK